MIHTADLFMDVVTALKALVAETKARDNPSDMGVCSDSDEVTYAEAVLVRAEQALYQQATAPKAKP